MKNQNLLRLALVTLVSGAFSLAIGSQEELAAAIQQSRTETILTHNELVSSIKALDALTTQKEGDLRPAFEAFRAGLVQTRVASERTQKRVGILNETGEKYFAAWQADVEKIKDEGIRTRAIKRLDKTRKSWTQVATSLKDATVQFPALGGYLDDIEKALTYDLTTEGVKSVRGAAKSASGAFGQIQGMVQRAVAELEQMSADMSTVTKA